MHTIVVGVDGSERSTAAALWGLRAAERRGAGLRLVHAWSIAHEFAHVRADTLLHGHLREHLETEAQQLAESVQRSLAGEQPSVAVEAQAAEGHAVSVLTSFAVDADLLVVGAHGRTTLGDVVLGSVAERCAERAACPVAIVRGETNPGPAAPILVAVDGSPVAEHALRWAFAEARNWSRPLRVAQMLPAPPPAIGAAWGADELAARPLIEVTRARERLARDAERVRVEEGARHVPLEAVVDEAPPAYGLVKRSAGAALLVVGSRGRGHVAGLLLGSVSRRCAAEAACPVVVVPGSAAAAAR